MYSNENGTNYRLDTRDQVPITEVWSIKNRVSKLFRDILLQSGNIHLNFYWYRVGDGEQDFRNNSYEPPVQGRSELCGTSLHAEGVTWNGGIQDYAVQLGVFPAYVEGGRACHRSLGVRNLGQNSLVSVGNSCFHQADFGLLFPKITDNTLQSLLHQILL